MKLSELLDQIDMLDGELLPDWKYNDRTGAVIANAYHKQGDKWSCLVAKDIPADRDGEFIALARTFAPAAAKALQAVIESCEETIRSVDKNLLPDERDHANRDHADMVLDAITDAMEGDDGNV